MRILILLLVSALSVVAGKWWLEDQDAIFLFARSGYWFVALNFTVFLFCLYRAYGDPAMRRLKCLDWKRYLLPSFIVLVSVLFVSRAEKAGFKTIMDEHTIASTSRGLHMHRQATVSMRLHDVNNRPVLMNNKVDKRPIFFPFLVSIVHDLFGYHPENSIRLNIYLFCPLLFVLLYVLGTRLGGDWGGGLLCLLIATIPLCGFIFRGGGLELLNMVMLIVVALIAMDFWKRPDALMCGALCFGTTLLAQTRYESVVFVLPVALLVGLSWIRHRTIEVYWPLFLTPLLLVPYLWQNRVFQVSDAQWQLEGKGRPFGLEYLPDNLERSVYYFFNFDVSVPNSWLLPIAGLIAGIFLLLLVVRKLRESGFEMSNQMIPLLAYLIAYAALYLLLLCYSWDFGGVVVQRLCLPLYLPMAAAIVILLASIDFNLKKCCVGIVVSLLVYALAYAYPVSSRRSYNMGLAWWEYSEIEAMFESGELDKDAIYITENASFYSIYGYSCASFLSAAANKQGIANYMEQPSARPIYVALRMTYSGNQNQFTDDNFSKLDSAFQIDSTPHAERWFGPSHKIIFSRLTGVEGYEAESKDYETPYEYQMDFLRMLP